MPTRLHLSFPGAKGDQPITFVCDSGDYDPGVALDIAQVQVLRLITTNDFGEPGATLTLEDV